MNDKIADILAQHLINLPFLTKTAGLVNELRVKVPQTGGTVAKPAASKVKKFPAARIIYTGEPLAGGTFNSSFNFSFRVGGVTTQVCERDEDYFDLIPTSKESGILYFEDGGSKLITQDNRKATYEGTLVLVCWLNRKKLGDMYKIHEFESCVNAHIPVNLARNGVVLGGSMRVDEILPNRPSPFEKYDYDEAERQYITHPFDYFSMKLKTKYIVSRVCALPITVNPEPCI